MVTLVCPCESGKWKVAYEPNDSIDAQIQYFDLKPEYLIIPKRSYSELESRKRMGAVKAYTNQNPGANALEFFQEEWPRLKPGSVYRGD